MFNVENAVSDAEKYAEQLEDETQKKLFNALFDDIQYDLLRSSILLPKVDSFL